MLQHRFKTIVGALIAGLCSVSTFAQIAQAPLLAKTVGQVPNIVFMFDDSASMPATAIYQYGGTAGVYGMSGPGNDTGSSAPTTFHGRSPNVNLMYYDPRETYSRRINADGTFMAAGSVSGISAFNVYFYNPGTTALYSVSSVTVNNKGSLYPASGVTGTFTAAPSGGTTATGTVTTASSGTASSVTINSGGANYPASGITASFSAPAAGGTNASGTVTIGTSGNISGVTVAAGGSGYATGTTATFSAPQQAGGVTATGTPNLTSTKTVSAVAVTFPGSGYTNGSAVSFTAAPTGGTTATGTITTGNYYKISSVTINSAGNGYPNPVNVTVSGTLAPGSTATTCTATRTNSASGRGIASISCTAGTGGYLAPPTLTLSTPTGATANYTVNTTTVTGIFSVNITNVGSGYTTNPTITAVAGGGSSATFSYTYGTTNRVTGFTMSNSGSGYTSNPTITLSSPGTGASFNITRGTTNVIQSINITNPGSGYASAPTITLAGVGSGAGANWTVNTGTTNVVQSVTVTNAGAGYLVPPTFTISSATGLGASFSVVTASTSAVGINGDWGGAGTPTTAASYFTPSYTPDAGSPLSTGATVLAYPNTANSSTASYPKFRNRTDCTASTTSCSWAEELQNYANWKAYHSTRLDLAKTGVGLAFQPLTSTFRLGWGTINDDLTSNNRLGAGVRLYNSTTRSAFLTWLYARTGTVGGTPNRTALDRVGNYYQRKDDNGPWGATPPIGSTSTLATTGTANANHASCRRNYAVLMTDGYYNDTITQTDTDSTTAQVNTAGVTYVPTGPYSDTSSSTKFSNTFADVSFKYWFNSLRPDLSQTALKTKPSDDATWPHMDFYAIGLGLVGTLDATNPAVLAGLSGGASSTPARSINWPSPTGNDPKAIDDMWHATINGHGLTLSAGTADKLRKSILQIISDVSGLQDSQAGVAASATSLTSTTEKFTPLFTSQNWTGNVQAHQLDPITANETTLTWEVETVASTDPLTGVSTYSSSIPTSSLRNIVVGNGATSGTRAVLFNKTAMDGASLTSLMTGTVTNNLINYLRGDSSLEASAVNVSNPGAIYRERQTRLGDIVNSTPVFVKGDLDQKYDTVPGATGYRAFVTAKIAQRKEGVLFVGGNDGMLHAFRDGATVSGGNSPTASPGGVEVFAYVPRAILPTINQLADKAYVHRYYVDGPSAEADAFLPTANRWANMVLGSTGAGAGAVSSAGVSPRTGVFAIDATNLSTSVTSLGASSVAWEVGSNLAAFGELGYVLSKIQAGPTLDGSWVAIFGNGYESASCKAQLFIVNIETGALIKKIDTGAGNCSTAKNGLGGVTVVRNSSQQIIGAYAGDLLGNAWKFNLNSSSSSNWKVDFGGDPLYKTRTGQPITAAPSVIDLATTPTVTTPKPGYMVVFETGKFYEDADLSTTTTQTIYGTWDATAFGASATATGIARVAESNLVARTQASIADGTNQITYSTSTKGWYYNFTHSGERMIYPMNVVLNRFVSGTSLTPTTSVTSDPCVSGSGGEGRPYFIDALSGAFIPFPLDPVIPPEPPPPPFDDCKTDPTKCTVKFITSDPLAPPGIDISCIKTNTCPPTATKNLKRRQWRQLFVR